MESPILFKVKHNLAMVESGHQIANASALECIEKLSILNCKMCLSDFSILACHMCT